MFVYATAFLPGVLSLIFAATDTAPPPWSLPAVIVAMGGALVYAYRSAEAARVQSEKEKYDLGIKAASALAESSDVLRRVLDRLPAPPR